MNSHTLFDPPPPQHFCPWCRQPIHGPLPRRVNSAPLIAGHDHPDVSHDAAKAARFLQSKRLRQALALFLARGEEGFTDDELDQITQWGHQCTSAVMSTARRSTTLFVWNGKKRKTRKGNMAMVNVLSQWGIEQARKP